MSIVLELPPELAKQLAAEAGHQKLELADYIVQFLSARHVPSPRLRNGSELVAYWQQQGLIGTRSDIADPSEHARQLRRQAERRNHG